MRENPDTPVIENLEDLYKLGKLQKMQKEAEAKAKQAKLHKLQQHLHIQQEAAAAAPPASPAAVEEAAPQARTGFGKLPFSKSLRGRRSPKKEAPPLARRESAGSHNTSSSRSRSLPRFKSRQHQEQQTTQQPAQQPHVRAESNGDRPRPVPGDDGVPRGGPRSRSAPRTKSSNYAQQQQRQRGWSDGQPGEGGGGQLTALLPPIRLHSPPCKMHGSMSPDDPAGAWP